MKRRKVFATNENLEFCSLLSFDSKRSPIATICSSAPHNATNYSLPLSLSFLSRLRDPDSTLKISEIANWSNWSSVRQALFCGRKTLGYFYVSHTSEILRVRLSYRALLSLDGGEDDDTLPNRADRDVSCERERGEEKRSERKGQILLSQMRDENDDDKPSRSRTRLSQRVSRREEKYRLTTI